MKAATRPVSRNMPGKNGVLARAFFSCGPKISHTNHSHHHQEAGGGTPCLGGPKMERKGVREGREEGLGGRIEKVWYEEREEREEGRTEGEVGEEGHGEYGKKQGKEGRKGRTKKMLWE